MWEKFIDDWTSTRNKEAEPKENQSQKEELSEK